MAFCNCRRRSGEREPFCVVDELEAELRGLLADRLPIEFIRTRGGAELELHVPRGGLLPVMAVLRDAPALDFAQLMDVCGVDWPERPERFDVVYNLLSLTRNERLRVITVTDAEQPVPSVAEIWPTATWFERETWDMYGVVFSGLPDLRRLLTDYGFEGHPLRKDFPLTGFVEMRYDAEAGRVVQEPVQLVQDFRSFDFMSPWEAMTTLPGDEKVHLNRIEGDKP